MAPIKVAYWPIRGLGAPLRMMCEYAGAEYESKLYTDGAEWFGKDKPELAAKNPLANLPYIVDGETVVCQSNACLMYLGEKFGLGGKSPQESIMIRQLLDEIYDLRNHMADLVYPHRQVSRNEEEFKANASECCEKKCSGTYGKLEKVLEMGSSKYFLADTMTTADFHIFEIVDQYELLAKKQGHPSPVANFPKLKAAYEAFKKEEKLQKYFASADYALPVNFAAGGAWFV